MKAMDSVTTAASHRITPVPSAAVPCMVSVGHTHWETSLWPKEGGYILPLKTAVRRAEDIELGDRIEVELEIE